MYLLMKILAARGKQVCTYHRTKFATKFRGATGINLSGPVSRCFNALRRSGDRPAKPFTPFG